MLDSVPAAIPVRSLGSYLNRWLVNAEIHPRNDENDESGSEHRILVNPYDNGVAVLTVNSHAAGNLFRLEASDPLTISPSPIQEYISYDEDENTIEFDKSIQGRSTVRLLIEMDESYRGEQQEVICVKFHEVDKIEAAHDVEIRSRLLE